MAPGRIRRARLFAYKWRWYQKNSLPWNRLAIHRELLARECFARWPLEGDVLKALRSGRLTLGPGVLFEPHVWISIMGTGRCHIGAHSSLNIGVFLSVAESVDIGSHCMFGNGCLITDAAHRHSDPTIPVPWQRMESQGPVRIGDNVWCGVNVAITGGVTIGERCIIGANSVVTRDLPSHTVCAGVPAVPIREITTDVPAEELHAQLDS